MTKVAERENLAIPSMHARRGLAHLAAILTVVIVIAAAGIAIYAFEGSLGGSISSETTTTSGANLSGLTMINATSTSPVTTSTYRPSSSSSANSSSVSSTSRNNGAANSGGTSSSSSVSQEPQNGSALFFAATSASDPELGLNLTLSAVGFYNGTLAIHAYVTNFRSVANNLTAAADWPYPAGQMRSYSGDCSDAVLPLGITILKGDFDSGNYASAQALELYNSAVPGTSCSTQTLNPTSYGFGPMNNYAAVYAPQFTGNYATDIEILTSGSWTTTGSASAAQFTRFSAGNYTLIAGDEWGQLALLHFSVVMTSSGSSSLSQDNTSSSMQAMSVPSAAPKLLAHEIP